MAQGAFQHPRAWRVKSPQIAVLRVICPGRYGGANRLSFSPLTSAAGRPSHPGHPETWISFPWCRSGGLPDQTHMPVTTPMHALPYPHCWLQSRFIIHVLEEKPYTAEKFTKYDLKELSDLTPEFIITQVHPLTKWHGDFYTYCSSTIPFALVEIKFRL